MVAEPGQDRPKKIWLTSSSLGKRAGFCGGELTHKRELWPMVGGKKIPKTIDTSKTTTLPTWGCANRGSYNRRPKKDQNLEELADR